MNERQKILALVQEGKLTPEQADLLIEALESRRGEQGKSTRPWDFKMNDIKQLSSQLTSYVSQSLSDVKRTVEQELRGLSGTFNFSGTLTATSELNVREGITDLFIETKNGRIGLSYWDEPFIRILVRGQVRASDLDEASEQLRAALQTSEERNRWQLAVRHDGKDGVQAADIDLLLPAGLNEVSVKTQNGAIRADSIPAEILRVTTANGAIFVYRADAGQLHLGTDNGAIDLQRSVTNRTKRVYLSTKNGTIDVEGIETTKSISGSAKSTNGRISVTASNLTAEFVDGPRNTHAKLSGAGDEGELLIQCETKNGAIHLRN